jgi:hypothetical protein
MGQKRDAVPFSEQGNNNLKNESRMSLLKDGAVGIKSPYSIYKAWYTIILFL